jgi:hypothetical protein
LAGIQLAVFRVDELVEERIRQTALGGDEEAAGEEADKGQSGIGFHLLSITVWS